MGLIPLPAGRKPKVGNHPDDNPYLDDAEGTLMSVDAEDAEILAEFIAESTESLGRIEQQLVALDKNEGGDQALAEIFRTMHTLKGTSSFLGFGNIEVVSHACEEILNCWRSKIARPDPATITLLLQAVDALSQLVGEAGGSGRSVDITQLHLVLRQRADELVMLREQAAAHPNPATPQNQELVLGPDAGEKQTSADLTLRVEVKILDSLMNLVGELVLARNRLQQFAKHSSDVHVGLNSVAQRIDLVTTELQGKVMQTRMQPISAVLDKLPRLVRDLTLQTGKSVELQMEGRETELDKTLLDSVRDPILHMVRNSVDHGVELPEERMRIGKPSVGRLIIRSFHDGGMVNIEIEDDGRGIDPVRLREKAVRQRLLEPAAAAALSDREALNLIFRAGFSTAEKVTSISGRGVGMDVVKTSIDRVGGQVEVQSNVGSGTRVRLKVPLTLAIVPALIVRLGRQQFAIPQNSVVELVQLRREDVSRRVEVIGNVETLRLRGKLLPLLRLEHAFGCGEHENDGFVIVINSGKRQLGIVVHDVCDTEEVVVKALHRQLAKVPCFAGAAVLGDGAIALVLDVAELARMLFKHNRDEVTERVGQEVTSVQARTIRHVLVFDAIGGARVALPIDGVSRLERLSNDSVELVGVRECLQYRGQVMSIVRPEQFADVAAADVEIDGTLVVTPLRQNVGLRLGPIHDLIALQGELDQVVGNRKGLLGLATISGKITPVLDVNAVLSRAVEER